MLINELNAFNLSIDIFRMLKYLKDSFVWIDFLGHLNDHNHKISVMDRIGSLYLNQMVLNIVVNYFYPVIGITKTTFMYYWKIVQ